MDTQIQRARQRLQELEGYQEAIDCFNKALELDSQLVYPWYNKGRSLYSIGHYDEAINCFDKALDREAIDCYNRVLESIGCS